MEEKQQIENKLKEMIEEMRPFIQLEGGDIEFVSYEDDYLYIRMLGNCATCIFQNDTIENNLLLSFQNEVPSLKGVINVDL